MKVYIASPFFKDEQIERVAFVEELLHVLRYEYFSPRKEFVVKPNATKEDREKGFTGNCKAIENSDFIIAITDGKDMGTIWEAGYAYGKNIPIVYFAETLGDNPFNLMLAESGISICKSRMNLRETLVELRSPDNINKLSSYEGEIE